MTAAKKIKMNFLLAWKLVNWYLVEGEKMWWEIGRGSTNGGWGVLVGENENEQIFLASAELLLIPCPNEKNPVIWSQFGPKLQNLKSDESLQSARGFFLI